MLEEGIDTSTFLHKSLLEYYAAAFIKHSTDDVARLFYQAAGENLRPWQEVLRFLSDIDPYRYSKEYALAQLASIRKEFIEPLKNRTDSTLLKIIRSVHPSFAAGYHRNASDVDNFELDSFGPFGARPRLMYEAFDDLLMSAMEETLPPDASRNELEDIIGRHIEEDDLNEEIVIPIHLAISYGGSKNFWNAADIFSARIEQMEIEANAIIAEQEKRKLIFQQNPTKGS